VKSQRGASMLEGMIALCFMCFVFFALLQPGDTYMGMNLTDGGHLSHGSPVNMSGKYFKVVPYGVSKETEQIDYDALQKQAEELQRQRMNQQKK